ncbi:MAG: oligosaccharide flippase family protein [Methyloprofundus sp.]|nr:oligosaccharide flippase family protein [Methyloprofundus sp.]
MNAKKIIHFSIGPIGAAALGLITLPFVAWFFSVEDVGRLTMLQVVLGLSVSFFSLAMHQAYVREYHEEEDRSALFKTAVVPGLLLITFVSIALVMSPISISNLLFGIDSGFLTFLLLVGIFSSFLINFLAHVVRMQERGLAFSATQIAPKAFLLIFIGLILLLNLGAEFKWLMLMNTLAVFASLMIFAVLTRDTWLPALFSTINNLLLKQMLLFGLPLVAGGLAYWGLTTMDRFFLRALSGFEELGVYAISVALAGAVAVISTIFSNLWHPVVYKWAKEGVKPKRLQAVIENMLIVVALIWSLVGLFSWILPSFLPPEYQAIEYLIVACVAMPLFYMLSETTVVGIGITRRTSFAMIASICAFIANLVLNYLLIPDYGAAGAALATLISFFVFFVIRTESSALLWHSFPRVRIYFLVVLYMLATSTMVLTEANLDYFYYVWLALMVLALTLYRKRLLESINHLKTYLHKRT